MAVQADLSLCNGAHAVCSFLMLRLFNKKATSRENLFLPYANNKGADQSAHPRSLISTFVVRCLDSIYLVSIYEISSL